MIKKNVWGKSYKGLRIKSDFRVHDTCFKILEEKFKNYETLKVLDIATGTGAFAKKISDQFSNWKIEINDFENQCNLKNIKKYAFNLNKPFRFKKSNYDLIIALEIIEHLENPWLFLKEIYKVLKKNGILILSTPNSDSTLDRLNFLLKGYPMYFGKDGFINSEGHITMVPHWLFEIISNQVGFKIENLIEEITTQPHIGLFTRIKFMLLLPLLPFMKNKNNRSINVYVCKK